MEQGRDILHSLVLVLLVLCPSSEAAAEPPVVEMPNKPLLLLVEVEVDPELLVCRASKADLVPVGRPVVNGRANRTIVRKLVSCMLNYVLLTPRDLGASDEEK